MLVNLAVQGGGITDEGSHVEGLCLPVQLVVDVMSSTELITVDDLADKWGGIISLHAWVMLLKVANPEYRSPGTRWALPECAGSDLAP